MPTAIRSPTPCRRSTSKRWRTSAPIPCRRTSVTAVRRYTSGPNIGLIAGVDQEPINVGSFDERGIDVALNYTFTVNDAAMALTGSSWGDGRINIGWNYSYLQQIEITAINGSTTNLRGLVRRAEEQVEP